MADQFLQGIFGAFDDQAQIRNEITVVAINWFANRCPLVTRVPRLPIGSTSFTMVNRFYRNRNVTLNANALVGDTTLALVDASTLMQGDVVEMVSGEHVEVIADPNLATNVVTVRRGAEGTTPTAGTNQDVLRLIGNSRTGSEVNQSSVGWKPVGVSQYCQTWQHPVQVGGSLQASTQYVAQPGVQTPLDQYKMDALQNLMDDMEVSSYYGKGEDPAVASRPKQKGLRTLLSANLVASPVNAGAYKPSDFIRDTLEKARLGGGDPDVFILSTNFMSGLATWGMAVQRVDAGVSIFGNPFDVFEAPFLGGVRLIEAPLLRPFTCITLTSSEVRLRMKRNEFWNPRGVRGDAVEGDWIAEGALEIDNQAHHGWLEGITAFSAT
ncbi:MAG TPA: DUF5309 family protein [Isosphaeraceae bacterium]|nr:DUF5309 family protein [Isosphaeraceae bacterium]